MNTALKAWAALISRPPPHTAERLPRGSLHSRTFGLSIFEAETVIVAVNDATQRCPQRLLLQDKNSSVAHRVR